MTRPESVEFRFARDWIHAGTHYAPGDVAHLPPLQAASLTDLGAGAAAADSVNASRRRSPASTTTTTANTEN